MLPKKVVCMGSSLVCMVHGLCVWGCTCARAVMSYLFGGRQLGNHRSWTLTIIRHGWINAA